MGGGVCTLCTYTLLCLEPQLLEEHENSGNLHLDIIPLLLSSKKASHYFNFLFFLLLERKRDFTLKAVDHKEDAEITQQKKRSYEKAFEGYNQKGSPVRDILQTVQQKHSEEMQNSPSTANEKSAITYLKLKGRPFIVNLV